MVSSSSSGAHKVSTASAFLHKMCSWCPILSSPSGSDPHSPLSPACCRVCQAPLWSLFIFPLSYRCSVLATHPPRHKHRSNVKESQTTITFQLFIFLHFSCLDFLPLCESTESAARHKQDWEERSEGYQLQRNAHTYMINIPYVTYI